MSRPLLVDTTSVFAFQQYLKDHDFPVQGNPNYGSLIAALERQCSDEELAPKLAFVSISFEHEGQKKFCSFLQHQGFIVDATDYRDAFVVPDRSSPYQRLSTRITYVAGLLSPKKPHLVIVTDAFDTFYPLLDFKETRGGQVTLAFFRSGLEPRWHRTGLFDSNSPIGFIDLDPYAKGILGTDLGSAHMQTTGRTGLGSLKL
jgi:hypothetical protein